MSYSPRVTSVRQQHIAFSTLPRASRTTTGSQRPLKHSHRRLLSALAGYSSRARPSAVPSSRVFPSSAPFLVCYIQLPSAPSGRPRVLHYNRVVGHRDSLHRCAARIGIGNAAAGMATGEVSAATSAAKTAQHAKHAAQQALAQDAIVWATQHGLVRPGSVTIL